MPACHLIRHNAMPTPLLFQILLACLLGGILSIGAAALIMFGLPRKWITLTVMILSAKARG